MSPPSGVDQRVLDVTRTYDTEAEIYEQLWASGLLDAGKRLIEKMDLDGAGWVLDLGCGVGKLLRPLHALAPQAVVVGADRSLGMLLRANSDHSRVVTDACPLAFRDATFDRIVMAFMLFHLPEPVEALAEARRCLRKRGVIGVTTWGETDIFDAFDVWIEELDAAGAPKATSSTFAQHELVDDPAKVSDLLIQAGYVDVAASTEQLQIQWDASSLEALATSMGGAASRFSQLGAAEQDRFLATVRARLADLGADAFLNTMDVVFATARSV